MNTHVSDSIRIFFSKFPLKTFTEGEIILRPDLPIKDIYLLKTGKVRMYSVTAQGDEITLHIFRSPAYFPVMLLLSNVSNMYYFEVLEQAEVFVAPALQVINFLKSDHDALFDLTKRFSDAMNGLLVRIETLASENAYTKLVHLLFYLGNRFGQKNGSTIVISLSISHEDLSNWLGLRRETVSRQIEKLQKENLVKIDNKTVIIIDTEKLAKSIQN